MDDDEDDREMLQKALHSIDAEHRIVEAHDGKHGLKQLQLLRDINCLPCLIVLDINMPGRSGLEALRDLRHEYPTLPVLMLSVHSEDQYAVLIVTIGDPAKQADVYNEMVVLMNQAGWAAVDLQVRQRIRQ